MFLFNKHLNIEMQTFILNGKDMLSNLLNQLNEAELFTG